MLMSTVFLSHLLHNRFTGDVERKDLVGGSPVQGCLAYSASNITESDAHDEGDGQTKRWADAAGISKTLGRPGQFYGFESDMHG